jgi:hypothetical protein
MNEGRGISVLAICGSPSAGSYNKAAEGNASRVSGRLSRAIVEGSAAAVSGRVR